MTYEAALRTLIDHLDRGMDVQTPEVREMAHALGIVHIDLVSIMSFQMLDICVGWEKAIRAADPRWIGPVIHPPYYGAHGDAWKVHWAFNGHDVSDTISTLRGESQSRFVAVLKAQLFSMGV